MADPLLFVGVGTSFVLSGVSLYLYKEKLKELQKLKEIPVFRPNQKLLKELQARQHKKLQYVAVEGRVQADGESLSSPYVPQCLGVVQKIAEQQQWKYWNPRSKTWNSRSTSRKESNNAVPFSLVDHQAYISDISIKVLNPLQASGSYLETVHCRVRRPVEGVVDVLLQGLSGEKPGAMEEREEMLRVGSVVTGFGEVVLESGNEMKLQAPHDGRAFILISSDHKSFMDRHEASASMWKSFAAFTGITGSVLLAKAVYSIMGKRDEKSK
ncbi:mitochondrial ubiquitin ligase activator of nfkb 1-A [Gouania willdenowi]|uniref:RING-type E3 ubiquitin transferase n=1 Tax=Gouania willdenowi TaxID=441366 RepID=A0A8C5HHK0_GOUWI|nr:mitochondrial ubiquitin ligase activator of nfkb 1-A-like [Gouania willdenowi]